MSYGIQVFNASGVKVFDSMDHEGGLLADIVTVPLGASATFDYPEYAGRSGFAMGAASAGSWAGQGQHVVADTTPGFPRFTIPSVTYGSRAFAIFIL